MGSGGARGSRRKCSIAEPAWSAAPKSIAEHTEFAELLSEGQRRVRGVREVHSAESQRRVRRVRGATRWETNAERAEFAEPTRWEASAGRAEFAEPLDGKPA